MSTEHDLEIRKSLIEQALNARAQTYSPYSKFAVGAAVLCDNQQIFIGTNIENASYGLTICAERVAIFNALSQGCRSLKWLAVASPGGYSPCGACRQVMFEFSKHLGILIVDSGNPEQLTETTILDLLPNPFSLEDN